MLVGSRADKLDPDMSKGLSLDHVRRRQDGPRAMRLVVARCEVTYTGRLTAVLPDAVRRPPPLKSDGSVLEHDDSGGYKPSKDFRPEA